MIRTIALFCLLAAPALGVTFDPDLNIHYDLNPLNFAKTSFMSMPTTATAAADKGWELTEGPEVPEGLETLELWCPTDDKTVCLYYDPDTGYWAGQLISFLDSKIEPVFDLTALGFAEWTTTVDGESVTYWSTAIFAVSADYLATDADERISDYDSSTLFQEGYLWLKSFNGDLMKISANAAELEDSVFTKQACFPWMGNHYYYNMTTSLECTEKTIHPWFLLTYSGHVVGVGLGIFGKQTSDTKYTESPSLAAVKIIVNDAPKCYYDYVASDGVITMHTYFIKNPYRMSCLLEAFGY